MTARSYPKAFPGGAYATRRGTQIIVRAVRPHARGWTVVGIERARPDLVPGDVVKYSGAYEQFCALCGVPR